jgi:hypothetical protein
MSIYTKEQHVRTSENSSFDKALLSVAEGLATNGLGASSDKVISCTFLKFR